MESNFKIKNWVDLGTKNQDDFLGKKKTEENKVCKHKKIRFIEERGEKVCITCGLVLENNILSSELSTHQFKGRQKERIKTRYQSKNKIPEDLRRALQRDTYSYSKRRRIRGVFEIDRIATKFNLTPQIIRHSKELFKKVIGKLENHYIHLVAIVCVYYYCERYSFPIELVQIIQDYHFTDKLARKYINEILRKENLSLKTKSAKDYVAKARSELNLPQKVGTYTHKLIELYESNKKCHSNSLRGICAGSLYLATKYYSIMKTQGEIAESLSVSEITLRSRFQEIKKLYRKYILAF